MSDGISRKSGLKYEEVKENAVANATGLSLFSGIYFNSSLQGPTGFDVTDSPTLKPYL